MLKKIITTTMFTASVFTLCAFSLQKAPQFLSQPKNERNAQNGLPQSSDPLWVAFAKCKVNMNQAKYTYSINYTSQVKALNGKQVTLSGFILPLESSNKFRHFLLSKRTPTCPFCPPGEPNEVVEVYTNSPIAWNEGLVKVTGTMTFTNNADMGIFFQIKNATANVPSLFDSFNPFNK